MTRYQRPCKQAPFHQRHVTKAFLLLSSVQSFCQDSSSEKKLAADDFGAGWGGEAPDTEPEGRYWRDKDTGAAMTGGRPPSTPTDGMRAGEAGR